MSEITRDADSHDKLAGGFGVLKLLKTLVPYFRNDTKSTLFIILLVIIHAVAGRGTIIILGKAIDLGIIGNNMPLLMRLALAYFLLSVFEMALQIGFDVWFTRIGNRALFRLRDDLTNHVQNLPIAYFDRVASGRIVTRLTADTVALTELFQQGLLRVFSGVITIIAITAAMALISWKMTILTLLVAPPLIWIAFKLSDKILVANRIAKRHVSAINAFVAETVSGVRVLQLFNRTSSHQKEFEKLSKTYFDASFYTAKLYAYFHPTVSLFTAITVATALYASGIVTAHGSVTTGAMIAFIFHVKDFAQPLRQILEKYQMFQNSVSSGERMFALFKEPEEVSYQVSREVSTTPKVPFETIEFKNVSFRYGEMLPWALDNVSFQLPHGQTLAIIGRTGSGKSTLISLLQRFRDPTVGKILIDGHSLVDIPRSEVRRRVGVVQQDVFMFRGTIEDNIGLGDSDITPEHIAWAAKEAGLERILQMRPGGIKAIVEEKGANLSVGERQLIAFARILAFNPQILVLDEATANVDSETERLLQAAAVRARKNRTSIIIAHRLSTIQDSDICLVLAHGSVEKIGKTSTVLSTLNESITTEA